MKTPDDKILLIGNVCPATRKLSKVSVLSDSL